MTSLAERLFPRDGKRAFVASLLVWNPVLAAAITFVLGGTRSFLPSWLISLVISQTIAVFCFSASFAFRRIETWVYRRRGQAPPRHRTGFYMLLSGLVAPAVLPLAFAAGGVVARALGYRWGGVDPAAYRMAIAFGFVIMGLFFLQRARADAKERIHELETTQLRAQLAALTAEMNPHLLFNALNTVASLVHQDPERAEEVVIELSELYRGVLRASGSATHALADEIGLCQAYLKIESARFGDRLRVAMEIDPALDTKAIAVPVLVAQPFVENAVKHGIAPRAAGGRVLLAAARVGSSIEVRIEDDGVGLGASEHQGAGKAIANCRQRLRLTYGDRASLQVEPRPAGGTRVVVAMPIDPCGATSPPLRAEPASGRS